MRTTCIMNMKGGTAKTVTAINAAAILDKYHSQRTLLIDADSQCNLSDFVARDPKNLDGAKGMADLLKGFAPMALVETIIPQAMLLPGHEDLLDLDVTTIKTGHSDPLALAGWLADVCRSDYYGKFDRCFIDCPPAFNAAAAAALYAADDVIIPVKLDAFGIRGLSRIIKQIRSMREINPDLKIAGVLPTMCYKDVALKAAEEDLRDSLEAVGIRCFHHIRRSPKVDGSTFEQMPLAYWSPNSAACIDYRNFVRELLGEEADRNGV